MNIDLPKRFDKEYLQPFFNMLDGAKNHPLRVTINFASLEFSTPTAMLVAGVVLRKWVSYRKAQGLDTWRSEINENNQVHSYLMHLGFFDFINIQAGKKIGEAKGSLTYLPIRVIKRPEQSAEVNGLKAWYESIESEARRLAGVVAGSHDDSKELRVYTYSIREIVRNVFEHSGADECLICGQRWANGVVEFAVVDEGKGISNSLRDIMDVESDEQALMQAISPGVSRTAGLADQENIYDNSGFGLYVLSQIGSNFGWFFMGSGQAQLVGFERSFTTSELSFFGTFVGIRLNKSPSDFRGLLEDIVSAGEQEALSTGRVRKASALSKLA
ncbi:hypothetical protein SAMN05660489_03176 [Pseudomonas sp. LAMO17WK12:I10]|uniref:ATP-binding protein n=1 Tax=unclassified Pseudomonas TaxID=196821 RepID=UPI000BCC4805|nr:MULTISPECIES: ATP-binding protein [unclassified Pseudomonas]PXX67554.1 hypothetical protein H160_03262 [Pseudomonas sp. LAMO17WK12:I9]SNY35205.1 hypothetical protein SAMN05660489_03176 [Pseudomonas sp. LAMO17WK12:I10]